jgi:pyruvate/2-oxoglutarate dehydrogenase complex dihydrolipoamide acyltransferase (E2) component
LLLSIFIWSLLFKIEVFIIFLLIAAFYFLMAFWRQNEHFNSLTQKIRMTAFDESGDPTLYASVEIDLTNADAFLNEYNQRSPETKLTYSHFGLMGLSRALSESKLASKLSFDAFSIDNHVDLGLIVDVEGENITALVMNKCDSRSLPEIASFINTKIKLAKSRKIKQINFQNKIINFFPSYVSKVIMQIGIFILSDVGIKLHSLAPKQSPRLHAAVSNISAFNIHDAYSALTAIAKLEIIAVMGAPVMRPVVVDGKIEPRKTMTIDLTVDARYINVEQCAVLIPRIKECWENPSIYEHLLKNN